ncbi:MAG TPA: hypothetical protein O0X32_02465 [Methanocorpusculum sp.]|nr:hypothetical protein [Methanocorpusculum sp.]
MIEYIIYESNAGHTKKYAEMLSEEVGIIAVPLIEAIRTIATGTNIFFMGWICGGKISGLQLAQQRFSLAAIAAVGIVFPSLEVVDKLIVQNSLDDGPNILEGPFFYLQGGVEPKKLGWIKRKILKMTANNIRREDPESKREWELIDALTIGADYVAKKISSQLFHG